MTPGVLKLIFYIINKMDNVYEDKAPPEYICGGAMKISTIRLDKKTSKGFYYFISYSNVVTKRDRLGCIDGDDINIYYYSKIKLEEI